MKRRPVSPWVTDLVYMLLGSACFGVSVALFSAPNDIAPGGLTGIATVAHYLFGLPIGTTVLVLNLPLLIAAWRYLGKALTVRSLIGIGLSASVIDLAGALLPAYTGDKLLAALCGGVLTGLGLGLILSRGATTGGSEIVARLLERRRPDIPIGRLMLFIDGAVIAFSSLVYRRLESALYATVLVYISSLLTDRIVYGGRRGKVVLIFTRRADDLTAAVLSGLGRGVTRLAAVGGYSGKDLPVLLCAVSRTELYPLKRLIAATDPQAFFLLLSADEVLGNGWLSLST